MMRCRLCVGHGERNEERLIRMELGALLRNEYEKNHKNLNVQVAE